MADQNITALPVSDTPASSDQLLLVGATEEKLIDYDKLADAILNKLTSKNFSLDQGTMPLIRALNELNSKTLSEKIHQQQSSDVESLIDMLISNTKEKNDGIFNICGSWQNHASGYSAIVQKIVYDALAIRISGIVFSFDGNLWIFTSNINNNNKTTKKIFFTMS